MSYRYFGLWALLILASGLAFVLYRWPGDRHKTFSQHVALRRTSIIYYSVLFSIVSPLLMIFFVGWFTPHFGLSLWLNVFVLLAAIFQVACTFVPETGGRKTSWHRTLAGLSAVFLMPALTLLLPSSIITSTSKLFVLTALLVMLGCIFIVGKSGGNPRNFLLIQCIYFAAFLLPIMYISYGANLLG